MLKCVLILIILHKYYEIYIYSFIKIIYYLYYTYIFIMATKQNKTKCYISYI